jgi:hypothetical protein
MQQSTADHKHFNRLIEDLLAMFHESEQLAHPSFKPAKILQPRDLETSLGQLTVEGSSSSESSSDSEKPKATESRKLKGTRRKVQS